MEGGSINFQGRSPNLTLRLKEVIASDIPDLLIGLPPCFGALDDYYIPTRYPDALPGMLPEGLPERAEAEQTVALAESVLERAVDWLRL